MKINFKVNKIQNKFESYDYEYFHPLNELNDTLYH